MSTKFIRISGLLAIVGSVILITGLLASLGISGDQSGDQSLEAVAFGLGALCLAAGLVGPLFRVGRAGWPARAGLGLAILGLLAIVAVAIASLLSFLGVTTASDGLWYVLMVGMFCMLVGMTVYGTITVVRGVVPAWAGLALILGGAGATLSFGLTFLPDNVVTESTDDVLSMAGMVTMLLFLAGWAVLGAAFLFGKAPRPTSDEGSTPTARGWGFPRRALPLFVALIAGGALLVAGIAVAAGPGSASTGSGSFAPAPPRTPSASARPIVIDTDMGMDDLMAILYLLRRDDVRVEAITVVGTGEVHCGPGVRHVRELLSLSGYPQVPVSCGRETPLRKGHSFPAEWRAGADNLQGLSLPPVSVPPSELPAPQLLASVIEKESGKITLLALGPLTNVAEALQSDATLASNLAGLYIMGGAVDVSGNVEVPGGNKWAEWNFYADPGAAAVVIGSAAPVTLAPLDASNDVPVTRSLLERLEQNRATPEAEFTYQLLKKNWGLAGSSGYRLWDTLTAALLTDDTLATWWNTIELRVIEEGPESGRTVAGEGGAKVRVALSADAEGFEELFLRTINGDER